MRGIKEGEVERGNGDAVITYVFKRHETLKKLSFLESTILGEEPF